ncbi:MAG: hypothetical protein VBE63_17735 [Lamprobacter sp.]|uniref:hypothetical protein n=1 Tax=Lamprobacter sp. TaxID=3100796 RepID=UPI002B25E241|nr:hypothetical protein [Lamprobacter sp.]MEA3641758.1 hypothetical protein [Lamprobacter sp.]
MKTSQALQSLKRRGFERHITELLRRRREHPSRSFFTAAGTMQPYAKAYLYQWLTPELPGGPEAIPSLQREAVSESCTLEDLQRHQQKPQHWAAAYRFVNVLAILEAEDVQLFSAPSDEPDTDTCRATQMNEYRDTLTVVAHPRWERAVDDDQVVYLNAE